MGEQATYTNPPRALREYGLILHATPAAVVRVLEGNQTGRSAVYVVGMDLGFDQRPGQGPVRTRDRSDLQAAERSRSPGFVALDMGIGVANELLPGLRVCAQGQRA